MLLMIVVLDVVMMTSKKNKEQVATKLSKTDSDYMLGRTIIEQLKGLIYTTIKRAHRRVKWGDEDDDKRMAEEIARDIYISWRDGKVFK